MIVEYVKAYKSSMMEEEQIRYSKAQQQVHITWVAPPAGSRVVCFKLDGAAKTSDNKSGCGGVLRNENGTWIEGFTKALGDTTAYMAELWGIYEGLRLAQRRKMTRLELRTDSQVIAQRLQDQQGGSNTGCTLMKKIRRLLDGPWEVKIIHVFREANRCADMLASMGSEGPIRIEFFTNPPLRVKQIVNDDFRGVSFPRLISM
ncbi:hypothetical protein TSUD_396480 [Trifolium subterraneum]|uniref:RNase H type-1 domain-containing protein n=1 Tax=Trifolium subterraneum TaxID=3900 RepID=A0A2Z6P4V1_TRISU|nr:hypothetical protein TSUD_396480 [Trifolium subterraneum]